MKRIVHYLSAVCILASLLDACSIQPEDIVPSAEFAPYVTAYTGGIVSSTSTIRVELTQERPVVDLNQALPENPFHFSPSLEGKAYWLNNHTLEFIPEEGALRPGQFYRAVFRLDRFAEVDKKLAKFEFSFRVQERTFALHAHPVILTEEEPGKAALGGELLFSDAADAETVEHILQVKTEEGEKLPVRVTTTEQPARFKFDVTSIPRKDKDYEVEILADGSARDIPCRQTAKVLIPAQGSFVFLSAQRISQPSNGVEAVFSAPLSQEQDLRGLIEVKEAGNTTLQVQDNIARIFFDETVQGSVTLNIDKGLRNSSGQLLGQTHTVAFDALQLPPQVELNALAAILPDSKRWIIPFRAVNLYAVDLSIIRIFEHNIMNFMQNNTLDSSDELRRFGRLVHKQTLYLANDPTKDIHQWENYSIDLSGLIRQEPGAIYRVVLSFKQDYSAYPCAGQAVPGRNIAGSNAGLAKTGGNAPSAEEEAEWDQSIAYYYYYGYRNVDWDWSQYDWRERDNPCHPSYYMVTSRAACCNVFASNIGLMVKRNETSGVWITVTNLMTAEPIKSAKVTLYNYQLQSIAHASTDSNGFVELHTQGVPFLAVAEAENQKAYLKLSDGLEQSVSRFDVGGKETQKGLKGFIYGERGVWRPGDTLHISFILEDREKRIPDTHPVSLELYNPRGQFHTKQVAAKGLNGFYTFALPTRQDDPTGLWNAYVKVGGTAFHKSLRIETVKPNRLKIQLSLPGKLLRAGEKSVSATLNSAWLTGATASSLKAKVEMSLSKVNTQFEKYGQYLFNNPATEFSSMKRTVFDGTLNATGKAVFPLALPAAANAPGLLNATLTTRVFEPGGDASIHTQTIPYSPFSAYVGINLHQPEGQSMETDKAHQFDIVTLDAEGRLTNRSNLEYKIYKVDWSWWWENRTESFGSYVNSSSIVPVASGKLQTNGGKAQFSFQVNYPEWGRYLVYVKDEDSGHATGGTIYIDWPEWRGRSVKADPDNIKMLSFSLDKPSYKIGDKATAIIPAAAGGRALATLENGTTVLKQEWIEITPGKNAKYTFRIEPGMTPNVYLHVSLLQPYAQTVNDLPIRMYGIMPVHVDDPATVLQPQISMPEILRPQTNFRINVSEKNGKPMTYTLAIVDDGLLDLTNFKTPDPWNEFYAREALGIRTWDMYDHVLGTTSGSYAAMFSTGGDETLKPAEAKANRFNPVVKFIGPFRLEKGGQQSHTLQLPMYVGSVRVMVVAGQDGAYGKADKTVPVRNPLMLLPTLPRVLSTGEEISLPVNVFALEKGVKEVKVSVEVSGCGIRVKGAAQQVLRFNKPGDQLLRFTLTTANQTGKATIRLAATGGGQQARENIEIDVRNPNPAVTLHSHAWVEKGKIRILPYRIPFGNSTATTVEMEVSRIPSVDVNRRFGFLFNYDHQCTEQLTSKALPLLYIHLFKTLDEQEKARTKQSVQDAVRQLYGRQLPNGGFVCWPGDAVADEWITSYAGMFLTLAQEKGYAVNRSVTGKWKSFQRSAAQNWRMPTGQDPTTQAQSSLQQAFRLYTLALADSPEQGAMNRMKELNNLPLQARWRLAAAYALAGQPQAADELIFNQSTTVAPYSGQNLTYGSPARDEAMTLETLLLMNRTQAAGEQARRVSANLNREERFDTQSTAFALYAMSQLAEKLSGTLDFAWSWNGRKQKDVKSTSATFVQPLSGNPAQGKIEVANHGEGALEMSLAIRTQLLEDTLPAIAEGIKVTVKYANLQGKPINVSRVQQGTDFQAIVTVSNISGTSDYTDLALTQILPSGWEIYNERLSQPQGNSARNYTYRDIRDDRVLTYFDLPRATQKQFAVRLQATYAGNFVLPAIACEAMYDTSVQARTTAGRTHVEE